MRVCVRFAAKGGGTQSRSLAGSRRVQRKTRCDRSRGLLGARGAPVGFDMPPRRRDDGGGIGSAPIQSALPGGSTFQVLLPAAVALAQQIGVSDSMAAAWLSANPASALGLRAGSLASDQPANVCVFDPSQAWLFGHAGSATRALHSAWLNEALLGEVCAVVVQGRLQVFESH